MPSPAGSPTKCLAYVTDQAQLPLALFAAAKAATVSESRDFDILLCSFEPLSIPEEIHALGIKNEVLPLREKLNSLNLRLKWLPLEVYLRLWLPETLGHRYDRILYADTDTYLRAPNLSLLFDVEMGSHAVAGVRDLHQWADLTLPVHDFAALNLPGDRFLNSGVLLMDSAAFTASNLLSEVLAINASDTPTSHHDQSLLNLALRGKWAELNPVWNWQWMHRCPHFTRLSDPCMLHFCGPKKPWFAHQRPNRFAPDLIREYQMFLKSYGGDMAFELPRSGGVRMSTFDNVKTWLWQRTHPDALHKLTGRFSTPFDTLI